MEYHYLYKMPITIHDDTFGNNLCWICNKEYKHFITNIKKLKDDLPEVHIKTCHPVCKRLVRRYAELENEMLEIEWELFSRKN